MQKESFEQIKAKKESILGTERESGKNEKIEEKIRRNKEFKKEFSNMLEGLMDKKSQEEAQEKINSAIGIFDKIEKIFSKKEKAPSKEDRIDKGKEPKEEEKTKDQAEENNLQKKYGEAVIGIREKFPTLKKFSDWYKKQPGWAKGMFKLHVPFFGQQLTLLEAFGLVESPQESKRYAEETGQKYKEDNSEKRARKLSAEILGRAFGVSGLGKFVGKIDKLSDQITGVMQNGVAMARVEREKEKRG